MLRALFAAALLLTAASASAQSPGPQTDVERPGGTYISLPIADAQSCAAQCARDGLCLAWTYTPRVCALKAVVTPVAPRQGAVSGLAPRAPQFAALVGHKEALSPLPSPLTGPPAPSPPRMAAISAVPLSGTSTAKLGAPDPLSRIVPTPPERVIAGPSSGPAALGYTWTASASAPWPNAKTPSAAAPAVPRPARMAWLEPRPPLDVSPKPTPPALAAIAAPPTGAEEELLGGPDDAS